MKNPSKKRLTGYGITAAGFLITGNVAEAQIIYTDLDPDVVKNFGGFTPNYILDIDATPPIDFYFGLNFGSIGWFGDNMVFAAPWFLDDNNGIAGLVYDYDGFFPVGMASQLSSGDEIGYGLDFVGFNDIASSSYYGQMILGVNPEFAGQENLWSDDNTPHFIGLRFTHAGAIHYGWARLSVAPGFAGFTLYDYAWNAAPGEPIIAGETGLVSCDTPEALVSGAITATSAKVKWSAIPDAAFYEIQFRIVGTPTWNTAPVDAPKSFRKLSGLDCSSNYEWQVRAICTDGGASAYSDVLTFTTLSCREASETSLEQHPIIYASGKDIYIDFEALNEKATIQIFDLNGKLLLEEISIETNTVIRTNLPAGIYLTHIIINEEMFTEKIVLK